MFPAPDVAKVNASNPIATVPFAFVEFIALPALKPNSTVFEKFPASPASPPIMIFLTPVVIFKPAKLPKIVLFFPSVKEILLPLNQSGDKEGCQFNKGKVTTPKGFKEAYKQFVEGGWQSAALDEQYAEKSGAKRDNSYTSSLSPSPSPPDS